MSIQRNQTNPLPEWEGISYCSLSIFASQFCCYFSFPTCLCGLPGIHTCSRQAKQMPSSFHSPFPYAQLPHIGIAFIFLPQLGQKSVIFLASVPCPRRYLANGIHIPQWVHCGVSASYTLHSAIPVTAPSLHWLVFQVHFQHSNPFSRFCHKGYICLFRRYLPNL